MNRDSIQETLAADKFAKTKSNIKTIAESRRDMMGLKPMGVDRLKAMWADMSLDDWGTEWGEKDETETKVTDKEARMQFVEAKGGKKSGTGFQGNATCAGSAAIRRKGKGKGFGKDSGGKGYGKNNGCDNGGWCGTGSSKGDCGRGATTAWAAATTKGMTRATTWCGALDHVIKGCPKNPRIQQVEDETPEVHFIGNVKDVKGEEWKHVPVNVNLGDFVKAPKTKSRVRSTRRVPMTECMREPFSASCAARRTSMMAPGGMVMYTNGGKIMPSTRERTIGSRWMSRANRAMGVANPLSSLTAWSR
jgi:hypothetical protein